MSALNPSLATAVFSWRSYHEGYDMEARLMVIWELKSGRDVDIRESKQEVQGDILVVISSDEYNRRPSNLENLGRRLAESRYLPGLRVDYIPGEGSENKARSWEYARGGAVIDSSIMTLAAD